VVAHQWRQHQVRQSQSAHGRQQIEAIVAHLGLDRRVLAPPLREELVEADRIDDGAGQDVRADLGALLDHDHAEVGRELLEPDRGGEPGGPGADDHHVELHRLAGGQLFTHRFPRTGLLRFNSNAPAKIPPF
jgi:hypothetical protein